MLWLGTSLKRSSAFLRLSQAALVVYIDLGRLCIVYVIADHKIVDEFFQARQVRQDSLRGQSLTFLDHHRHLEKSVGFLEVVCFPVERRERVFQPRPAAVLARISGICFQRLPLVLNVFFDTLDVRSTGQAALFHLISKQLWQRPGKKFKN